MGDLVIGYNSGNCGRIFGRPMLGTIYTRTGRAFFDQELSQKLIRQLNTDLNQGHYFTKNNTDFVLLSDLLIETEYKVVTNEKSEEEAILWWEEMTENGHEGFVVKPERFIARNEKGRLV